MVAVYLSEGHGDHSPSCHVERMEFLYKKKRGNHSESACFSTPGFTEWSGSIIQRALVLVHRDSQSGRAAF